ncbi:MAG TPA: hypothetical protein DCS93_34780 [Microscillaceae bacterium]|nr:hypothetical protein [Microscillaceae bacterium]
MSLAINKNLHTIGIVLFSLLVFAQVSCTQAQQPGLVEKPANTTSRESIVVGQKLKLYSKVLGEEKELYLALPPKYQEQVQTYPVVLVLEAEYLFETTASTIKLLQDRSKMPQSIVVGLANGKRNKRNELAFSTHGGKPKAYLQFIKDELIPYIEENYRANAHRTIIGLSPTNGLLFEAFWSAPQVFKGYIALSTHWEWPPAKGVTMVDKFIQTITQPDYPAASIYMGTADGDMRYSQQSYRNAIDKLNQKPATKVNYQVDLLKDEEHYAMAIVGIRRGFKLIYPHQEWDFPKASDSKHPVAHLKKHYTHLSQQYGFEVYPVEDSHTYSNCLSGMAYNFARWKHKYTNTQTIALLELSIGYYPNSANLHKMLAEAYQRGGQKKMATQKAQKAIKLAAKYYPDELKHYKQQLEKIILKK